MAKLLIGIVAALACFCMVESLTCNQCSFSLFGYCISATTPTCNTNTSVCFTTQTTFPGLTSFSGLVKYGCAESSACATNTTSNLNGTFGPSFCSFSYAVSSTCCSTDKCNTVNTSGAAANTMSLSLALSVAALAAMWQSYM